MTKQLKINELKRVVDLDKFAKYASILKDTKFHNEKEMSKILKELDTKTPSRDVLMNTRLGFILKEIANRETLSRNVRDQAKQLRLKWKEFHKRLLLAPAFDVKCDKPTTENRERARQALSNAFTRSNASKAASTGDLNRVSFKSDCEDHVTLIAELEFTIFQHCDKLVNQKYFAKCRQAIKLVSENINVRNKFLNGQIDSNQFVKSYLDNTSIKKYLSSCSNLAASNDLEMLDEEAARIEEVVEDDFQIIINHRKS
jgi:hypothetical protein